MGSVCSCFPVESYEDHGCLNYSVFMNCICLRCLTQQLMHLYTTLFQRGEVRQIQARAALASTASVTDSSACDTYRSPPRPLPYDDPRCSRLQLDGLVSRHDKSSIHFHDESQPLRGSNCESGTEPLAKCKSNYEGGSKLCYPESSLKNTSTELIKEVVYVFASSEDEDVCPTCLEEYTTENPKITMKCSHHFHLSCIYEWMERSEACPVCGKVMVFNETT